MTERFNADPPVASCMWRDTIIVITDSGKIYTYAKDDTRDDEYFWRCIGRID